MTMINEEDIEEYEEEKSERLYRMCTCSSCGKRFHPSPHWLYKIGNYNKQNKTKNPITHQCSYTCWRAAGGDQGYGIPTGKDRENKNGSSM